ncbi:unnamed protein product [Macrosiphum euphorbiae]|uniref:HAT C-terminal dimerisation domain-containing protein n=1 Tax=Macrosiphum euphorbiae TaxID=13131 RepID=A0AAV0WR63_9HEMI|nr:unnamed protein product [Macrosiphum euphorbiae]
MGRKITNPVLRMYFVYNVSTNTSTCTILDCPHPVRSGCHAGNLENHVKAFHQNEYKELLKEKSKVSSSCHNEYEPSSSIVKKQKYGPLDKMICVTKTTLTNVKLNKKNIIEACVQLVTTNGRPFTLLNDTGFRMIMDPIMNSIGGALLKKENMNLCILDIVTRWNSTYLMLLRLIELKPFCTDHQLINTDLFLNTRDWDRIDNLVKSLQPAFLCTKLLQKKDLTLGDFYGIWIQTQNKLNLINTSISKSVLHFMKIRQDKLLENDVFIATIYLDPRYLCLLNAATKKKAVSHLLTTWSLKESLSLTAIAIENSNKELVEPAALDDDSNSLEKETSVITDDFEEFIRTTSQPISTANSINLNNSINDIKKKIEDFANTDRVHYKENVVQYWLAKKNEMPQLFELAEIVMAVPATQVSVERSFSGLKFILSDLRSSLSSQMLENILIIRGNSL